MKRAWQLGRCMFFMLMLPAFELAFAASVGDNVWTSIGPEGGAVQAMVIDPQNSSTIYAVAGGGIFKSTDQVSTWKRVYSPATSDGAANYPAYIVVIDPQNTNALYAGTTGGGIFKNEDGGASWSAGSSGLPTLPDGTYASVSTLVIDPQSPSTIYAAVSGVYPAVRGIFKSRDGGTTWSAANFGLPSPVTNSQCCIALAIDPQNPSVLYAGTGTGIFKSWNGGANWTASSSGLPISNPGNPSSSYDTVTVLAIDPQNTSRVYAARQGVFYGNQNSSISISSDGGASWTPRGALRAFVFSIVIDPDDPGTIYAATGSGVLRSTDGGASWTALNSRLSVPFLAIDPQNPSTLYAAGGSQTALAGAFKSTDGGESWNFVNISGLVATSVGLAVDPTSSGTLYAAAGGKVSKTMDRGAHWEDVYPATPIDDSASIYPASLVVTDPTVPDTLYVGTSGGGNDSGGGGVFKSEDGGANWTRFPLPRHGRVQGLAIDPENSSIIYAWIPQNEYTGSGLFKSWDGAASWSELDSVAPFRGISNLWIDPQNSATLYARTNSFFSPGSIPALVKSTDGGGSWAAVTPTMMTFSGDDYQAVTIAVRSLTIDPQNSNTVYAVTNQGVFKSTDGAATWGAVDFNLPTDSAGTVSITSFVIAPQNSNLFYATTNKGVLKSADGGASWTAMNSGLTTLSIQFLAIDPQNTSTVYAGTSGGGIFAITFAPGP